MLPSREELWGQLEKLARAALAEPKSALLIIGPLILLVALSGAVPYAPISNPYGQLVGAAIGILLTFAGLYFVFQEVSKPFGVEILNPQNNGPVASSVVTGTVGNIPDGKELWLVRIYSDDRFYPAMRVSVARGDKRWREEFDFGSARRIGAFVFGKEGLALISYEREAAERHNSWMEQLKVPSNAKNRYLPSFKRELTKILRITECHVVTIASAPTGNPQLINAATLGANESFDSATQTSKDIGKQSREDVIFQRMNKALSDSDFTWRTVERLAIIAGVKEREAHEILAGRDEIVLGKGKKSGKTIARLARRNVSDDDADEE